MPTTLFPGIKMSRSPRSRRLNLEKSLQKKWFSGFQTLVAVHKDKEHIHCHLVTNSVSYEDGRKLHNTKKDLECMKQLTNQMCRERGLTIAEKRKTL